MELKSQIPSGPVQMKWEQHKLERSESCGGHFRTEYQLDGEAERNDVEFCHVAAWEYTGQGNKPIRNVEPLTFDNVHLATRSYK